MRTVFSIRNEIYIYFVFLCLELKIIGYIYTEMGKSLNENSGISIHVLSSMLRQKE